MAIEDDVAALIVSVDALIEAVNIKKAELDAAVLAALGGLTGPTDVPGLAELLALKAPLASPTFTGTVSAPFFVGDGSGLTNLPSSGGGSVDGMEDVPGLVAALAAKAPLASPTFTGTVNGITKTMVGLGNVDNTSDANKPVSTAQQTALNLKISTADIVNVLTSTATDRPLSAAQGKALKDALDAAVLGGGGITGTADVPGLDAALAARILTSSIVNSLTSTDATVPLSAAQGKVLKDALDAAVIGGGGGVTTFSALTDVELSALANLNLFYWDSAAGKIRNSSIATLGIETATGAQDKVDTLSATLTALIGTKAPLASPTFTGTVTGVTKAMVGLSAVDNTSDADKPISSAQATALAGKAPLASPTFTGTVSGITAAMVGLGNVNNTADSAKPVSTAQQAALDLKAPLANPTFTGTVSGVTKTMVGLGNVDNTADTAKPVSTAQQTALNLKANAANPVFTGSITEQDYTMTGTVLEPDNGTMQIKTLSAPATLTDGLASGQSMSLNLVNGATHAVTWPTITWVSATGNDAPVLTANDTFVFWKLGSTLFGRYSGSSV